MKKVNVILCTYNGEKYLDELIESLLAQTYRNINIFIRDDGSSDGTIEILNKYDSIERDGIKIFVLKDDLGNLGYVKNFIEVINRATDAEYYAFCDQDDYWLPNKIKNAVELMDVCDPNQEILYSCAYETRNEKLEFISEGHIPTSFDKLDVAKVLCLYDGGWLLGFTLVLNKKLKEKAFGKIDEEIYSHDIWAQAVAVGSNGKFVYDERVGAYFRRHGSTTSIAEKNESNSFMHLWKYRWNEMFGKGSTFKRVRCSIICFKELYANDDLKNKDKKFLELFGDSQTKSTIKKVLYPNRMKKSLLAEIAWRFAILLKKI